MKYDKYEEQQDFSLNNKNKNKIIFQKKSKSKTNNNIYTTKHIRKTLKNLNKTSK